MKTICIDEEINYNHKIFHVFVLDSSKKTSTMQTNFNCLEDAFEEICDMIQDANCTDILFDIDLELMNMIKMKLSKTFKFLNFNYSKVSREVGKIIDDNRYTLFGYYHAKEGYNIK
jgi:hypothetical protein